MPIWVTSYNLAMLILAIALPLLLWRNGRGFWKALLIAVPLWLLLAIPVGMLLSGVPW